MKQFFLNQIKGLNGHVTDCSQDIVSKIRKELDDRFVGGLLALLFLTVASLLVVGVGDGLGRGHAHCVETYHLIPLQQKRTFNTCRGMTYHHVWNQQIYRASQIRRLQVILDEASRPEDSVDGTTH